MQSLGAQTSHRDPGHQQSPLGVTQPATEYRDPQPRNLHLIRREGDKLQAAVETFLGQRKIGVR